MNEAEVVTQYWVVNELIWSLLQWWVSISFAVMVAAYLSSKQLTRILISLIIAMYSFYSVIMQQAVVGQLQIMRVLRDELNMLGQVSPLGLTAQTVVDSAGGTIGLLLVFFTITAFTVTNGFVLYCYFKLRKTDS